MVSLARNYIAVKERCDSEEYYKRRVNLPALDVSTGTVHKGHVWNELITTHFKPVMKGVVPLEEVVETS